MELKIIYSGSQIGQSNFNKNPIIDVLTNPVKGRNYKILNSQYNSRASLWMIELKGRKAIDLWNGRTIEGINTIKIGTPEVAKDI